MTDTGLLKHPLRPALAHSLFGARIGADADEDLHLMAAVDRAHLCMLAEQGILARRTVLELLREIDQLEREEFSQLMGRPLPRGLFLAYEDFLRERTGDNIGGSLQTARSRNDLNAALSRLRLRRPDGALIRALCRLLRTCCATARTNIQTSMPAYTHYQAAFPTTLGHYLQGAATALSRDLRNLVAASDGLDESPLGACAGGGTTLPIAPHRVSRFLGFARESVNSLDAVASRDFALRLLAAAAIAGGTLSRVAQDLQFWSSSDVAFVSFDDDLVGSSSIMPQKRNPFLLEHIKGMAASPAAAFQGALMAMHSAPFTNSVAVGTEAMRDVVEALDRLALAVAFLEAMVRGIRADAGRMRASAENGAVTAAAMAESWVQTHRGAFRNAHHDIGLRIREASEGGSQHLQLPPLVDVVQRAQYGGGPGALLSFAEVDSSLRLALGFLLDRRRRISAGKRGLDEAIDLLRRQDGAA